MAEIELSVLARQCLNRRLDSLPLVQTEVAAWQTRRNAVAASIDWRFITADARIRLKHLYPHLSAVMQYYSGVAVFDGANVQKPIGFFAIETR